MQEKPEAYFLPRRLAETSTKTGSKDLRNEPDCTIPDRGKPHKEIQVNTITKTASVTVLFAFGLAVGIQAAEPPKPDDARSESLPFTVKVTKEEVKVSPPYMGGEGQDHPFCAVKIEGEYWIFLHPAPSRWMGTSFLDTVKQPDGRNSNKKHVRVPYILGGMWYDEAEKKLYAPLHCEEKRGQFGSPKVDREIHLCSSTDKGATWKYEGPLVTRDDPKARWREAHEFSSGYYDGGDGDFYLFVDTRGGYIYLYSNHYTYITNANRPIYLRHRVARCAIGDKMAPGKWKKFYNGKWEEPGLGGKASYVDGYYVMYNSYLKKYISFNYGSGISVCNDMDKQDWSPSYEILPKEQWGTEWTLGPRMGFGWGGWQVMNEDRTDIYDGGKTLYFYKYWMGYKTECYRLDLDTAPAKENHGYHALGGHAFTPTVYSGPLMLYGDVPFYDSADPIESRRTRRLERGSAEVTASPGWNKDGVSSKAGSSLEFGFKATDVYWRTARGPEMGKADIYLDGKLDATVDTWASAATRDMFAYVKTGLDPSVQHTLKVVVRGEKNPRATGAAVAHLGFEYSADTTRALYAFSGLQGKNHWRYQERLAGKLIDMKFDNGVWVGDGGAVIGPNYLASGRSEPVRTWTAHRGGTIRIEGAIKGQEPLAAVILHNGESVWPKAGPAAVPAHVHDLRIAVKEGDTVSFMARLAAGDAPAAMTQPANPRDSKGGPPPTALTWDPVLTYVEP